MIGIYKITSPNGRIYIGQSIDIQNRFKRYKYLDCKTQTKLYRSIIKYGYKNHVFEIVETCEKNILNERERYWQDFYNSTSKKNLNCRLTKSKDKSGEMSKESRLKMSKTRTGKKRTGDLIERLRLINTGSKRSDESRLKMSLAQTGKKRTIESRQKQSLSAKGRVVSEETKLKFSLNNPNSRKVICLTTGKIYLSLSECSRKNNLVYKTLWNDLKKGKNEKFKYYE
jgi:group I intron endonuclease